MFITHQFYENSMSGANSYVTAFATLAEARNEMYQSIYSSLAHCEKNDMETMVAILMVHDQGDSAIQETIGDFTIEYTQNEYEIRDNYGEDRYFFRILDVDKGDVSSSF